MIDIEIFLVLIIVVVLIGIIGFILWLIKYKASRKSRRYDKFKVELIHYFESYKTDEGKAIKEHVLNEMISYLKNDDYQSRFMTEGSERAKEGVLGDLRNLTRMAERQIKTEYLIELERRLDEIKSKNKRDFNLP